MFTNPLLQDSFVRDQFSDQTNLDDYLTVEVGLVDGLIAAGLCPSDIGQALKDAILSADISQEAIKDATARDGVPIANLIKQLRKNVDPAHAHLIHSRATSQDILDTAFSLKLKRILPAIKSHLDSILNSLSDLARGHVDTPVLAHTRGQAAGVTSLGLRVARWHAGLSEASVDLETHLKSGQKAWLGGALGDRADFGENSQLVLEGFAEGLDLDPARTGGQVSRVSMARLGQSCALTCAALGKIANDCLDMAQSGIDEVSVTGGSSSAMPHKSNPVIAESIVSLASLCEHGVGAMLSSVYGRLERDGSSLQAEWETLPQLLEWCSASLRLTDKLLNGLTVNSESMLRNIERTEGRWLAPIIQKKLAVSLGMNTASETVRRALDAQRTQGGHLIDHLSSQVSDKIDLIDIRCPLKTLPLDRTQILKNLLKQSM